MLISANSDGKPSTNRAHPAESSRPRGLYSSKSFSRFEPRQQEPRSRNRASTLQNGTINETLSPEKQNFSHGHNEDIPSQGDVFEKRNSDESPRKPRTTSLQSRVTMEGLPDDFDELPIELMSLTDR